MRQFEAHMKTWAQHMGDWSVDMSAWSQQMEAWGQDMQAWGNQVQAWGQRMEQLGQQLNAMLVADGLIEAGERDVDLKFYDDHMQVEGQRVEGKAYAKYQALLKRYRVRIGPDGEMIITPPVRE